MMKRERVRLTQIVNPIDHSVSMATGRQKRLEVVPE